MPADRFVIDASVNGAEVGPDHNGSYMVFAKIEQLVDRFEEFCAESALRINADWGRDDVTPEAAAALMIGRYRDGTRVDLRRFPEKPEVVGGDLNGFTFDDDPYGRVCPLGAHVRKMNPRTNEVGDAHRILRRGVPYGSEGSEDEKGLLFVCYQASLAAGFEYLQQRWANGLISSAETGLNGRLTSARRGGKSLLNLNWRRHLPAMRMCYRSTRRPIPSSGCLAVWGRPRSSCLDPTTWAARRASHCSTSGCATEPATTSSHHR